MYRAAGVFYSELPNRSIYEKSSRLVFEKCLVQVSAIQPVIIVDICRCSPQVLHVNAGIVTPLNHERKKKEMKVI
jgi:hypothetical protein